MTAASHPPDSNAPQYPRAMETSTSGNTSHSSWWPVGVSAAVFAWWLAAVAWLAIPRYDICAAIYPAPPGCGTTDRVTTGVIASVVMLVLFTALVWLARRFTSNPVIGWIATVVFAIAAVATYRVVLY